jgi:hypothetical protein
VFVDTPAVRAVIVVLMNLVWYPHVATRWSLSLAALLLARAAAFAIFAGWLSERRDVA